ncbi:MAG: hypothetical protein AB7S72_00020 [Draconibacterium sp.]
MSIDNNKNLVTDRVRIIGINNVPAKAGVLWFEVEKRLKPSSKHNDINEKILPHERIKVLKKSRDEVGEKIKTQDDIIYQASKISLHEFVNCNKIKAYSTDEDRERSTNNQLSWEYSFVQNYAFILAKNDIKKLNDCADNPNGTTHKEIVNQLVNAIELINEYNKLIKDIEDTKASKKIEDLKKEMDTKDEDNKYYKILSRELKTQLDEVQAQKQNQPKPITGLKSNISVDKAQKLCRILRGEYIPQETSEINFAAVFCEEPLPAGFTIVEWIKKQKRNKAERNKKAVFDLLKLAGINLNNTDLPTINRLICGDLTHSNWNGNKGINSKSEAYTELNNIISQL